MDRTMNIAACFVLGLAWASSAQADLVTVPLNSKFQGSIVDPAHPVGFTFEGIDGIKASLVIDGTGGFRPLVRILDTSATEVLATATADANGHAAIPEFIPPASGQYILEVGGTATSPLGSFTGSLQGKVPSELKSAKYPKDSQPGDVLSFFALAGTELNGKLRIWTKPHPPADWFTLSGPSGTIDTKFQTTYGGFNKFAYLSKVVLPATGTYTIAPSQPTFRLTGNVKLKPPKGGSTVFDVGNEPFIAVLPAPVLDPLPTATKSNSIQVSGTASDAAQVELVTESNSVLATVTNGTFAATLPLVQNSQNVIHATAIGSNGVRSLPTMGRITHDAEPPLVAIQTPLNNASILSATAHVSGVVGDRLSGASGITVTVNSIAASVGIGNGEYGTFERKNVSLPLTTNTITVVATDALGNSTTKQISVKKALGTGAATLALNSGDGQSGVVGADVANPLVVKVLTASGTAFANKLVEFKVSRGDGRLGTTPGFGGGAARLLVTTDAGGLATVRYRLGGEAGNSANRVTASSAGVTGVAEFTFGATAGAASRIAAVSGGNQLGPIGAELARPLVVRVSDGRNPIPGVGVRFQVLAGGGSVGGQPEFSALSDAVGRVVVPWRLGRLEENQRVIATAAGVAGFATFDARAVQSTVSPSTTLSGVVHDGANQTLVGAAVQLFVNGAAVATVDTALDGRFSFANVPPGAARVVVDGTSVDLVGAAGIGTAVAPQFAFASQSTSTFALARGAVNVLPLPLVVPSLDQGKKTYNGNGDQVFTIAQLEGFKLTLASGTVVTLANGLAVPGPGGSVQIGVAAVAGDDLPQALPDALAPEIGIVVDPPGMRFGSPLPLEVPNTAALPVGARAAVLQFNPDTRRFDTVSELVSTGRTLVNEINTGLTRSGFVVIATKPLAEVARVECAGLALGAFERTLAAAHDALAADVAARSALANASADLVVAVQEFRATVDGAASDNAITAGEWTALKTALGAVESSIFVVDGLGAERSPIANALALDGGFAAVIDEAAQSSCGPAVAAAGAAAQGAYAGGLKSLLAQLDAIFEGRSSALSSIRGTTTVLKVLFASDPPVDAVTQLASPTAQFLGAETQFDAAASELDAVLAAAPHDAVGSAHAPLATAIAALGSGSAAPGAALRAAGQIALADDGGRVSIRGIGADGAVHVVTGVDVGASAVTFGRSASFVADGGLDDAALGFAFAAVPAASVTGLALTPQALDVQVGNVGQFSLIASQAYGTSLDVTSGAMGTVWRSTDSTVALLGADGSVTGLKPGVVIASGRSNDYVAARRVSSIGNHQVTISGIALFNATTPAANATVSTTSGAATTTAADGSFSLPLLVPSNSNSVTLLVSGSFFGQPVYGVATFVIEESGPADAGILTLAPATNVLLLKSGSTVPGLGSVNNSILTMNNGFFANAGTAWNLGFSCWWTTPTSTVEFDLANKFVLFSATCQADDNDTYIVEHLDFFSGTWKQVWEVPNIDAVGTGLYSRPVATDTTQKYEFPAPVIGSKIRIRAGSGDNQFAVSELAIYGVLAN